MFTENSTDDRSDQPNLSKINAKIDNLIMFVTEFRNEFQEFVNSKNDTPMRLCIVNVSNSFKPKNVHFFIVIILIFFHQSNGVLDQGEGFDPDQLFTRDAAHNDVDNNNQAQSTEFELAHSSLNVNNLFAQQQFSMVFSLQNFVKQCIIHIFLILNRISLFLLKG